MKIISWNMAHKHESWRCLLDMDIDLALLQEACTPPPDVAERIRDDPAIDVDRAPWETTIVGGKAKFRTAIVKLSNRIAVEWIETKLIDAAGGEDLVVGSPGTLAGRLRCAALRRSPGGRLDVCSVGQHARSVGTQLYRLGRLRSPRRFRPVRVHPG